MCSVSMIGDHYSDKWNDRSWYSVDLNQLRPPVSREEFDALKAEVVELKELLRRAKKYDEENGEPDCEMADKVALIRKVAELVGVEIDDVLKA